MSTSAQPNILVVSDLHLGEDVKPHTVGYLRHVVQLERELEAFLAHHTATRLDGRPWRLIVNGDMVDFMGMCLFPEESEAVSAEERQFGLGNGPLAARRKLLRVVDRHPGVFRRLAGFVAAGNDLVIVIGNHDVEFHFEAVQEALRERMAALHAAEVGRPAPTVRAELDERVAFHPWFYYQEDLLYVEHGHQYDEYCSFDYWLHPVGPRESEGILLSFAAACSRFMSNMIPSSEPHAAEAWGLVDYVKWVWTLGLRGMVRAAYYYAYCLWRLAQVGRTLREATADARRRAAHDGRLRELAARYRLSEETLHALDALRRRPVVLSLWKVLRTLLVDRLLLGLATLVGAALAVGYLPGPWWKGAGVVGLGAAAAGINELLARQRLLDPTPRLGVVPRAIRRYLRAPFIVLGHSHDAQVVPLPGGGTYFNTGTWVATRAGRPPFTHLVIRHAADGPRAELCQWRDGGSAPYLLPADG